MVLSERASEIKVLQSSNKSRAIDNPHYNIQALFTEKRMKKTAELFINVEEKLCIIFCSFSGRF